jgi:hypothetical protein
MPTIPNTITGATLVDDDMKPIQLPTPEGDRVCGAVTEDHFNESCWAQFCEKHGQTIIPGNADAWGYDTVTGCNYPLPANSE